MILEDNLQPKKEQAMEKLTREEKLRIIHAANVARDAGDIEEASRLSRKIPLAPHLARI